MLSGITVLFVSLGTLVAIWILVLLGSQLPKWFARKDGGQVTPRAASNGKLYGQLILYVGFAVLFLLDFFLFLRRDGFRA